MIKVGEEVRGKKGVRGKIREERGVLWTQKLSYKHIMPKITIKVV